MGFFSKIKKQTAPREKCRSFVTFKCGGQSYGLPLELLCEITAKPLFSKLPVSEPAFAGVMDNKGEACMVYDLSITLLGTPSRPGAKNCVLILSRNGVKRGCLVEEPGEIVTIPESAIDSAVTEGFRLARYSGSRLLLPERELYFP